MLIYGNTPKDIVKMMFRNKTKVLLLAGALAFVLMTGTAKADPQTVINNLASVPGKLQNHIQMEITKTKEFQKQSWAEAKAQWSALITKLSSK
jgi:hypothetical protein